MTHKSLTPEYAVSPQIGPDDLEGFKEAGFSTIVCNRPDWEIPPEIGSGPMQEAAEAAGFTFVVNPIAGGQLTPDNVSVQRAAMDDSDGPVLAYCASGNRSTIVWAFTMAGTIPTAELIATAERAGYSLGGLADLLERFAEGA